MDLRLVNRVALGTLVIGTVCATLCPGVPVWPGNPGGALLAQTPLASLSIQEKKGTSAAEKPGKSESKDVEADPARKAELIAEFQKVLNEEPTVAETDHLIVLAPKSIGKKVGDWAKLAEKHREIAIKALKLDEESVQETKIGLFLWQTPDQLRSYIRRVERKSAEKDDVSSVNANDWVLRAAGIAPGTREGALGDHRAGELVAGLLVGRAAHRAASVPEWLSSGFGRATTWKLASPNLRPLVDEKRRVVLLSRKYGAWEILNGEPTPAEAPALQASVLYYMAFVGTYAPKFPKFIEGFEPDENNNTRGLDQIFTYAEIDRSGFASAWKAWAGR